MAPKVSVPRDYRLDLGRRTTGSFSSSTRGSRQSHAPSLSPRGSLLEYRSPLERTGCGSISKRGQEPCLNPEYLLLARIVSRWFGGSWGLPALEVLPWEGVTNTLFSAASQYEFAPVNPFSAGSGKSRGLRGPGTVAYTLILFGPF